MTGVLSIWIMLWSGLAAASPCRPDTSRALLTGETVEAARQCLLEAVPRAKGQDWVASARAWLRALDHLAYVFRPVEKEPVAIRSVRERGWLADAGRAAEALVAAPDRAPDPALKALAEQIFEALPLRGTDPRLAQYRVTVAEPGARLTLELAGQELDGAGLVAEAGRSIPVRAMGNGFGADLPSGLILKPVDHPGWQVVRLQMPVRGKVQTWHLILPRIPERAARYVLTWKEEDHRIQRRTLTFEPDMLASSVLEVREREDRFCPEAGWQLLPDTLKVDVLHVQYGEVLAQGVRDGCAYVRLKARPYGAAFGSKYIKRGEIQVRLTVDAQSGERVVRPGDHRQGDLLWGQPVRLQVPAKAREVTLALEWLDGEREVIRPDSSITRARWGEITPAGEGGWEFWSRGLDRYLRRVY